METRNNLAGWTLLIFGVLVLVGGIIGFAKAHSFASLVMGTLFAILLGLSSLMQFRRQLAGFYLGIASTAILGGFFGYRYAVTHNFMPAGLMLVLSVVVVVIVLWNCCRAK